MFKKSIFALCVFTLVLSSCTIIKPVSDTDEKGNYIVPKKQRILRKSKFPTKMS